MRRRRILCGLLAAALALDLSFSSSAMGLVTAFAEPIEEPLVEEEIIDIEPVLEEEIADEAIEEQSAKKTIDDEWTEVEEDLPMEAGLAFSQSSISITGCQVGDLSRIDLTQYLSGGSSSEYEYSITYDSHVDAAVDEESGELYIPHNVAHEDIYITVKASVKGTTETASLTVNIGAVTEPEGIEKYNVYVNGLQVTSTNKDDVLGDGSVVYEPPASGSNTPVITLTDAKLTMGYSFFESRYEVYNYTIYSPKALKIIQNGDCTIQSKNRPVNYYDYMDGLSDSYEMSYGIYCGTGLDFNGNGSLTISDRDYGIYINSSYSWLALNSGVLRTENIYTAKTEDGLRFSSNATLIAASTKDASPVNTILYALDSATYYDYYYSENADGTDLIFCTLTTLKNKLAEENSSVRYIKIEPACAFQIQELTATVHPSSIQLDWTLPECTECKISISRSDEVDGTYNSIGAGTVQGNSYTDTTAERGKTYYYKIKVSARDALGYSRSAMATISAYIDTFDAPANVHVENTINGQTISWDPVNGADTYVIDYRVGGTSIRKQVTSTSTSYTLEPLTGSSGNIMLHYTVSAQSHDAVTNTVIKEGLESEVKYLRVSPFTFDKYLPESNWNITAYDGKWTINLASYTTYYNDGYLIYRYKDGVLDKIVESVHVSDNQFEYVDDDYQVGKTYSFSVQSYAKSDQETYYGATVDCGSYEYEGTVKGLNVANAGASADKITWNALKNYSSYAYSFFYWKNASWEALDPVAADYKNILDFINTNAFDVVGDYQDSSNVWVPSPENGSKYYFEVRPIAAIQSSDSGTYLTTNVYDITGIYGMHLDAPEKFTAAVGSYVKLTWKKNAYATGYKIYRKSGKGSYQLLKTITDNSTISYTDKEVADGTLYSYKIEAFADCGKYGSFTSAASETTTYYLKAVKLSNPTNIKSGVKISWTRNANADGYVIYRKTNSGKYIPIKNVTNKDTLNYVDITAIGGERYRYMVYPYKTFNGEMIEGLGSNYKTTYFVYMPTKLSTVNLAKKKMYISWKWSGSNAGTLGYKVQYSLYPSFKKSTTKTVTAKKLTLSKLTKGKRYYVRVRAYNKIGKKYYYSGWAGPKSLVIKK